MMGAAKKLQRWPEDEYLETARRDGRLTHTDRFLMKTIGRPDNRFQGRTETDPNHVRLLNNKYEEKGNLDPVVIFKCVRTGKCILADGFHRWEVYSNTGRFSIPAYVIASESVEHDAMGYAAMCNQRLCKPRSPDDVRKIINLLLSDDAWWAKADSVIADHVGCSGSTVRRIRCDVASCTGKSLPTKVVTREGWTQKYAAPRTGLPTIQTHQKKDKKKPYFVVRHKRRNLYFGPSEEKAKVIHEKAMTTIVAHRSSLELCDLAGKLATAGYSRIIKGTGQSRNYPGVNALHRGNDVCASCDFGGPAALPAAVGMLVGARQLVGGEGRSIVLCYREDGPANVIELYENAGFEFMTPEELVESLKPQ